MMIKISIPSIIGFRRKSEKSKLSFLNSLEKEKVKDVENEESGGGNYWISCLSAIKNVFRYDNMNLIEEKIEYLQGKIEATNIKMTQTRWQKNIDILHNFQDFDLKSIRPPFELKFLKKNQTKSIVQVHKIPVETQPSYIFTFGNKDSEEIGAIWFVIKKGGYTKSELGMFCDITYKYLNENYSDKYKINTDYCIAIDIFDGHEVRYSQLLNGDISVLLDDTISEIKKTLSL